MCVPQPREEKEEEDEILAELTRKQAELKAVVSGIVSANMAWVFAFQITLPNLCLLLPPSPSLKSEFNRQQLQTLVNLARTEINRQEIKKEAREVRVDVRATQSIQFELGG